MGSTLRRIVRYGVHVLSVCLKHFDRTIRLMGPAMVLIASVLISGVIYAWFHSILPSLGARLGPALQAMFAMFGVFLVVNIVFNYVMVVMTAPGSPPPNDDTLETGPLLNPTPQQQAKGYKWCKKCQAPKPPRAHHCSICRKCVLKMDHHCPWVSGCVGHYNYRYFFLFLLYLWIGCVYVWTTSLHLFLETNPLRTDRDHTEMEVTFAFVITVAVTLALGILLVWHIFLVLTGQTTIEYYENRSNPGDSIFRLQVNHAWDLGWRLNVQGALGIAGCPENPLWWFLPTRTPVDGDGCTFDDKWQVIRKRRAVIIPVPPEEV